MRHLIAFVGFKGAGKGSAATALYRYGFVPLSFADALKDALATIFCWDRSLLEGDTDQSRAWREQIDPWWAEKLGIPHFTPRWAMTHIGTAVMREHFDPNIWVYNVERRLLLVDSPVVFADARSSNEIALTRRYGARLIRINRGADPLWLHHAKEAAAGSAWHVEEMARWDVHESEWRWLNERIDDAVDNGSNIEQLHMKIERLLSLDETFDRRRSLASE